MADNPTLASSRRALALAVVLLLTLGACSDSRPRATPPTTTQATTGSLLGGLITPSQLRRVPGFSTATVTGVPDVSVFADPDPRGPCGAVIVPPALTDAVGAAWESNTIRGGAQVVVRRPAAELQRYMAARIANTSQGCPPFFVTTRTGAQQEVKFESAVRVTRQADQSFAVVMAVKVGAEVRAQTIIEVRTGNLLSRVVLFTSGPLGGSIIRGIASLAAKSLLNVS